MARLILSTLALIAIPLAAQAQPRPGGGFGGGVRPSGTLLPAVSPTMPGISPLMPSISPVTGGGFNAINRPNHRPIYPGGWGVHGGWFPFGFGVAPVYPYPVPVEVPVPVFVPVLPPEPPIRLSGESRAVLVLEFPAIAEVWVDGVKGEGEPNTEWTLTSPGQETGTDFTFKVKARWKANGKTFEMERNYVVSAGNRSKALVVSGTEIK